MVDRLAMHGLPFADALSAALSSLPAADLTGIDNFSILDMRAWSVAKVDERQRYILTFHTIHNILAPVHRLPPDILSRVFVEAWQDRRSIRLTHVCRLWRSLLLDTTEFWAVAIARDKFHLRSDNERGVCEEDYLGVACLRSAPRNISLHLSSISPNGHLQLIRHAGRITSMRISAHTQDQQELLWKVLHTGMPRLESLAIRASTSFSGWAGPTKLSAEKLPLLARLTLPTSLFRCAWPNTLEEISFRPCLESTEFFSSVTVSLDMVLRSLEDYPKLRVLDIQDRALFHDPHSRPPSRAFPALELLRIRSQYDTISAMLSLLTFPRSTRVDIGLVPALHPHHEDFFASVSSLDAVVALVDQVAIHSASGSSPSTIHGHTDGAERLCISASLSQIFAGATHLFARTNAPVSRLLFTEHVSHRLPAVAIRRIIFPVFPRLVHLAFHCHSSVCGELLEALLPPSIPSSGLEPGLLPLPLLEDLTIGFATKRRSWISKEVRYGDICGNDVIAIHFRECCKIFPEALSRRREWGSCLSRLEFFSYEEGSMTKPDPNPAVSHVDLTVLCPNLVERELEPLKELVDGPVVFSGYRFFTKA